jgi:DNA-binding response OmpR family regulator
MPEDEPRMGQPRVLVVDDEWMLRDLVVCALSAAGYAVDVALLRWSIADGWRLVW